jgi:hypothetical protein
MAGFTFSTIMQSKYEIEDKVSLKDVQNAVQDRTLPMSVAEKYLKLYVADIDWQSHIAILWKNALTKFKDQDLAKEHIKKAVACATILPFLEKTPIPDPPSNLLFWCTGWRQFHENDWFDLLVDIMKEDIEISLNRNKIIEVGVIDPIDVSPITRQAYNWLYDKASDTYIVQNNLSNDQINDIKLKFTNLVRAYGGAIICNMFVNHKMNIDKVTNWRSGYFFEKQIYKVYSLDKIIKIKTAEINKTNQKYIKKVGVQNG